MQVIPLPQGLPGPLVIQFSKRRGQVRNVGVVESSVLRRFRGVRGDVLEDALDHLVGVPTLIPCDIVGSDNKEIRCSIL